MSAPALISTLPAFVIFGCVGAALIGLGLYGLAVQPHVLRKIIAWNIFGSGVFLIFGAISDRNAQAGLADPLPQAVVITGIVVAVSSTALALAIARKIHDATGDATLDPGTGSE